MIRTGEVIPGIDDTLHRMVAEVLACADTCPDTLNEHRREKINSFPAQSREAVRATSWKVIRAREEP